MKRTSGQKGITLVALIITIVVLLILAVVTIRAVSGDGIINYAKNARSEYELAQANEQARLDSYISQLESERGNILGTGTTEGEDGTGDEQEPEPTVITWTQTKGTVTNGAGRTIEVGDYINYASGVSGYTDTNGWRVLGAEDGKILLVSATSVANSVDIDPSNDSTTQTKIQNVCGKYDAGTHVVANSARTLKAEDIHRITGYTYNGSSADGQKLTVTRVNPDENDGIKLRWTITKDGATIKEGKSYNDEATFYKYGLTELTVGESFTVDYLGASDSYDMASYLGDSPQALDMFADMTGTADDYETASYCFLNNKWVTFEHNDGDDEWSNTLYAFCGYQNIFGSNINYDYIEWNMHDGGQSNSGGEGGKLYAVVTLNQDITLTPAGDHAWTLPTE